MSFKRVFKNIEPQVINTDMLMKIILEQGPKGEAGRLYREEGIDMADVKVIRLEFLRILRIDHLWMMTGLTHLSLSNNLIENIENLDKLVNLKDLDLSFNHITKIENMDTFENLEILTLYSNDITTIENMDNLKKLHIFSIGMNQIEDRENVFHLRQLRKLKSLNMCNNPCAKAPDFRNFVVTFLPQISYYEYVHVKPEEREIGKENYKQLLEQVKEGERDRLEREAKEAAEKAEAEAHAESFVEFLGGSQLFDSMFENDPDAKVLMMAGEETEIFYKEYETNFTATTRQLFEIGQQACITRKDEVSQFFQCTDTARLENQKKSQLIIEEFLEQKREIFNTIKDMQRSFNFGDDEATYEYADKLNFYAEDFTDIIHVTWKSLMSLELQLFDQIEEINLKFERNLTEMVNSFIEAAQGLFTICRNLEAIFMDQLNEINQKVQANLGSPEEGDIPEELKSVLEDKEVFDNCIGASHDIHLQKIDGREDRLVSRAKAWLNNLVDNLQKNEIKRNRNKVLEINHFLDIQKEEFEDLHEAPLGDVMDEGSQDD